MLGEHPSVRNKICTDGKSKSLFANAVVSGQVNRRIAEAITNYNCQRYKAKLNDKSSN